MVHGSMMVLAVQMLVLAMLAQVVLPSQEGQPSTYPDLGDFKKGLKQNAQRCANAYHVQYLQVMTVMESPVKTGYDRNSKCFMCCMMSRYQMITADGEFLDGNMRRVVSELPASQMKTVADKYLDTCLREDNDDICEKCYQFAKCYYDRAKTQNGSNKKLKLQMQQLNRHYGGSEPPQGNSGKLFQSVGRWAQSQWNSAANGVSRQN